MTVLATFSTTYGSTTVHTTLYVTDAVSKMTAAQKADYITTAKRERVRMAEQLEPVKKREPRPEREPLNYGKNDDYESDVIVRRSRR
jgi:hypothetical protein